MSIPPNPPVTKASFLKDFRNMQIQIALEHGSHLHLKLRRSDTGFYHFDIISWPGHLCYTGDMGSFLFRAATDMIQFFRTANLYSDAPPFDYWAQKCEALDRVDGVWQWSPDIFRQSIEETLEDVEADEPMRKAVARDVLPHVDDGERDAKQAAMDFQHNGRWPFADAWEWRTKEWSPRFMWCCYAIPQAISMFDALKAEQEARP